MTSTFAYGSTREGHSEPTLRRDLAALFRLLAHFRMTDLINTHASVRLPGPENHFLINPYGLLFEEVRASDLVKIDLAGEPVEPTTHRVNPAGFVIHSAIHGARTDAECIVHTHTRAGCAVAAQVDGLLPLNQMSLEFYDRVGYHDYEGVALNLEEQARIVGSLGGHHALILRNHGLLTVGLDIAHAFWRMFYLERACDIQIAAQASARLLVPSAEISEHTARQFEGDAQQARDDFSDEDYVELNWKAMLRLVERIAPDYAA